ncbi:MAG TPA: glycosyltransferase family 2 protein [Bacteroidia bacterium]|nr:glycosyltransferase family 2 protein [Bacteroidia bacterium]HNU33606.1 glycosyltransferase family 2 protein [Bacteroidia bacterium]
MKTEQFSIPFFSIIMPVYNREDFLRESVYTVLNQSFKNFELICIDDGSTDGSLPIIEEHAKADKRIKIIRQENYGRCIARNAGLNAAVGNWICFLDSDDGYLQNHLLEIKTLIERNPSYKAFATEQIIGNKLKEYKQKKFRDDECVVLLNDFLTSNPVSLNQFCYSRIAHPNIRFPNMNILNSEDLLFMRMFSTKEKILKVNLITNYVNEHVGRSVNQSTASEYVKWHRFAADYFIKNFLKKKSDISKIQSFTNLLLSNVFLSNRNKTDGLKFFFEALKYPSSITNLLFYKAIIKLIF